ncbi:hypothetical protein D3C81_1245890 [compost metagenome]
MWVAGGVQTCQQTPVSDGGAGLANTNNLAPACSDQIMNSHAAIGNVQCGKTGHFLTAKVEIEFAVLQVTRYISERLWDGIDSAARDQNFAVDLRE